MRFTTIIQYRIYRPFIHTSVMLIYLGKLLSKAFSYRHFHVLLHTAIFIMLTSIYHDTCNAGLYDWQRLAWAEIRQFCNNITIYYALLHAR